MKAYRIKEWDYYFENSESRKVGKTTFVCIPNSHDDKNFARLAKHKNSVGLLCGWLLLLQLASKMPQRGLLVDEDGPLSIEDMAAMTRYPEEVFKKALDVLSSPEFGWIEVINCPEKITISGKNPVEITVRKITGTYRDSSGLAGTCRDLPGRTEGNGTEGTEVLPAKNLPVEPDNPSKSPRKEEESPPDPRHSTIVKGWCEGYEKAFGRKYPLNGGKEGKHLKQFLERCRDETPDQIVSTAKKAWERAKIDPYSKFCKNAGVFTRFLDDYAGIISELSKVQNGNGVKRQAATAEEHSKGFFKR